MPKNKITSFEWGRVIAMLAIITIHSQIFMNLPLTGEIPWLGWVSNQISRFAVPFFFILAGYWIQPRLESDPWGTLKQYSKPLFVVWISWSFICLILPFNLQLLMDQGYWAERTRYWGFLAQNPINSFFEGGLVHLWYLPALVMSVALIALIRQLHSTYWLWSVAAILYIYALGAGSYHHITDWTAPIFTRNGPFFGYLMVLIGHEIRRHRFQFTTKQAIALFCIGFTLHFSEGLWLYVAHQVPLNSHDFLFGTPIWGLGFFALLQSRPQWGNSEKTLSISPRIFGIYLAHLLIIIYYGNVMRLLNTPNWITDLSIIPMTFLITYFIIKQIEKTPLNRVLLRG